MRFRDIIAPAMAHLVENRIYTGLSILGIFIGVTSVLCMMAIGEGVKKIISDDLEKLGGPNQIRFWTRLSVRKQGHRRYRTTERYTLEDAQALEAECPEILFTLSKNAGYETLITSRNGSQARPALDGVTADYARGMHWEVQVGRFLSENDIKEARQVCVLGANTAIELFGRASPLGQEVKIRYSWRMPPVRLMIIGVMQTKGRSLNSPVSLDNSICVPLTTYQQRISGIRYVENIIIFFRKNADVYRIIDSVKDILRKRHRGKDDFIGYWIPQRSIKRLEHIEKIIKIALGGIAGFSLFVSGIGIMNICLVSVGEKTREIGLRKAVGARRIDILYQFLTESISLCLCGTILGIAGGWLFAHGMARVAVRILPIVEVWPVVLSVRWMVISVLFSIFMGIIFGVYPAIRASRMSPIDALRTDT